MSTDAKKSSAPNRFTRERGEAEGGLQPDIVAGDEIEVRDACGDWHPKVARSGPFLNTAYVGRGVTPWQVIKVDWADGRLVNWPASDVRLRRGGQV